MNSYPLQRTLCLYLGADKIDDPIHDACHCAKHQNRTGDREHLYGHTVSNCLCQAKTNFFLIFLSEFKNRCRFLAKHAHLPCWCKKPRIARESSSKTGNLYFQALSHLSKCGASHYCRCFPLSFAANRTWPFVPRSRREALFLTADTAYIWKQRASRFRALRNTAQ